MLEPQSAYPTLYQLNTRVRITDLARDLGRSATLDDIPDADLDEIAALGFTWVWLLSVWSTGDAGRRVSRTRDEFRREFEATLPDLREEDIEGSGFAITGYTVAPLLGGDAALARLRQRLAGRGLRLMLDFVPNHMALDHPWVTEHPDRFILGIEADLMREPANWTRVAAGNRSLVVAHGRDPYFPGWPDTIQLDYANPATRAAMSDELDRVAARCDGVRCDMAMLVLPEVFERTWSRTPEPFWPAAIAGVRTRRPGFVFMAEVYWDLEWTMIGQGFDYAYDKRLYDRLRGNDALAVRGHLTADLAYQRHLARFLENHDEPRAAATFQPRSRREAADVITYLTPGLRLLHMGQLEGRSIRISPHLVRGPAEVVDEVARSFYERLLAVLVRREVREGVWHLLDTQPAWDGDDAVTGLLAWSWTGGGQDRLLVAVNDSPGTGRGFVRLPAEWLDTALLRFDDLLNDAAYERDGADLATRGLFLEIGPWAYHAFAVTSL